MTATLNLYNIQPPIKVSKDIALVGNSDFLLSKDKSAEIDSFQDVMRFNFSNIMPTHTGKKTTIRWVNCPIDIHSAKQHAPQIVSDTQFSQYVKKLFMNVQVIAWESIKEKLQLYSDKIQVHKPNGLCTNGNINTFLESLGIKHKLDTTIESWPRTGFQAVLSCIKSGCTPHLFGFDLMERDVIYHYSKAQLYVTDNITQHQVRNEIAILRELRDNNFIVVHI